MSVKTAKEINQEVQDLERQLQAKKTQLSNIQRSCRHQWGKIVYDPIITPAYHIAGDPPGFGGVDHQFPMDIPEDVRKRWRRTCQLCELEQETFHTKRVTRTGSVPGTTGEEDVPSF